MILFHGSPSSYVHYLMQKEKHFHLIAMDYPGFGQSDSPNRKVFNYTFEHISWIIDLFIQKLNLNKFYMFIFDYGAPIGFRISLKHPDKFLGIISQNGNIYKEGLWKKWEARAEYWEKPSKELREQYKSAFAKDTVIGQFKFWTEEADSPDGYSLDLYYAKTIPIMKKYNLI